MKFLNFLFSKITFFIILLLIYIFGIYLFWKLVERRFVLANIVLLTGEIILLITLLNRDTPTSFKLPWMIIVLVSPFLGMILYFFFGDLKIRRNQSIKIMKTFDESRLSLEESKIDLIDNDVCKAQARYIQNNTKMPVCNNTEITYFNCGENFFTQYLSDLEKAKKYIFLEYFIVDPGIMYDSIIAILKKKIENGVEVYFIYDDFGSYLKIKKEIMLLKEIGIKIVSFSKISLFKSWFQNNRDHRKITVIDGVVAYTGGINIADEYINKKKRFGYWKDSVIRLKGEGVKNYVCLFCQMYNTITKDKIEYKYYINRNDNKVNDEGFSLSFGTGPKSIYKNYIAFSLYMNIIETSTKYLYITTPYLIVDYFFIEALCNAAKRGVDVKIITPHIPDKKIIFMMTQSNYEKLIKNGVKVYEYSPGFMHAKIFLCDDIVGVMGTINLDYRSLIHHYECATWLYKTKCLNDIKKDFLYTIENKSIRIKNEKRRLCIIKRFFKSILNLFSPLL